MQIVHAIITVLLVMLISSCTGLSTKDIAEIKKIPRPYDQTNDYSMALDKFSAMLLAYDVPEATVYLMGKNVQNRTACQNLPLDVTQMMATAVNRIGGRIQYIPYNPTYLELEARLGLPVGRETPLLVFDGAITECDENLEIKDIGYQGDVTGTVQGNEGTIGGDWGKTNNLTRLALDMHLMDYQTSLLLPRMQSSLAVSIGSIKGGYNFSIQVLGSGFGLSRSHKITQGKHEAIRALVDLSVLQVLGKYLQVPYWRCLENATPDQSVIRELEATFSRVARENGIAAIQTILRKYGYSSVQSSGTVDDATSMAIGEVAAKSDGRVSAEISPSLYSYLYINMPLNLSQPWIVGDSLPPVEAELPQSQEPETGYAPAPESPAPPPPRHQETIQPQLGLQTAVIYRPGKLGETVLVSGGTLTSGDQYKIVVEPEQDCYLYVFQRDSAGRLFPIFPRADRRDGLANPVRGKIPYEFPGEGLYFFLDQRRGEEQIYFYSSARPDGIIEQALQQINQNLSDTGKHSIEKQLLQYLATKDTISTSRPGKSYPLKGTNGMQSISLNHVQKLTNDKLYIFSFTHQ